MAEGLANEGFDIDLEKALVRENALVELLALPSDRYVEVKCDRRCRETGNVFIEYRQKGRPSGIATSHADIYAIEVLDDTWVLVRTGRLKELARRAIKAGRTAKGGDYNLYDGALLPVDWIVRSGVQAVPGPAGFNGHAAPAAARPCVVCGLECDEGDRNTDDTYLHWECWRHGVRPAQ